MTTEPTFDPSAPLPGPPDPWDSAPTPSRRAGPPYHMTDMIAAEPALAGRIVERLAGRRRPAAGLADAIRAALDGRRAGRRHRLRHVRARRRWPSPRSCARRPRRPACDGAGSRRAQAFELSLARRRAGSSSASRTRAATAPRTPRWRRPGPPARRPRVITVSGRLAGRRRWPAIVVETGELDQSWCHTVGYLSPILAAAAVGAPPVGPAARPGDGGATCSPPGRATSAGAERIAGRSRRRRAPPGRRLRRGPAGRPRARAQGRGGGLAAVRVPRPRDVPARPPAGDRREHRPRPDPRRSRPARRAAGAGSPGAGGGAGHRPAGGGDRGRGAGRGARRRR